MTAAKKRPAKRPPPAKDDDTPETIERLKAGVTKRREEFGWIFLEDELHGTT